MGSRANRTVYVGNLPGDVREREVEDLFYKYGPIVDIDLKIPPRPPGYAFVEFEDARDAEDAIRGRDGYNFNGHRLRVELAHGGRGHSSSADRHSTHSGGGGTRGPSRRSDFRVLVTGLPSSASWQDLKDHMRRAGDVCFSQVFRDGRVDNANISISINPAVTGRTPEGVGIFSLPFTISALAVLKRRTLVLEGSIIANQAMQCGAGTTGIVDYTNYDDMKCAIKKLDDSEFRNAFTRAYIRVKEYDSRHSPSRSRSRSYSRSRSPSRSRSDNKSRSQSKSPKAKNPRRSPLRSRSRSVSSHSRSVSKERSLSRSRSRSRSHSPSPSRNKGASKSPRKRSPSRSRSLSR